MLNLLFVFLYKNLFFGLFLSFLKVKFIYLSKWYVFVYLVVLVLIALFLN